MERARVIGVDPSLTATGLACVDVRPGRVDVVASRVVETTTDADRPDRLWEIHVAVREFCGPFEDTKPYYAVENFSFGSPFGREVAGMVGGVVLVALRLGGADHIEMVTPAAAKKVACPDWPGTSLANWSKAGYTKKFKRSMPSKAAVMAGLRRRYGVRVVDDAVADAVCVAASWGLDLLEGTG